MPDYITMLVNLTASAGPLFNSLFFNVVGLIGFFLIVNAMTTWVAEIRGSGMMSQQGTGARVISGLTVGSLLLSINAVIIVMSNTFFSVDAAPKFLNTSTALPTTGSTIQERLRIAIGAMSIWIVLFGYIAVARGLIRIRDGIKYNLQGTGKSSAVLITAGVFLINITTFSQMLFNTFYGTGVYNIQPWFQNLNSATTTLPSTL